MSRTNPTIKPNTEDANSDPCLQYDQSFEGLVQLGYLVQVAFIPPPTFLRLLLCKDPTLASPGAQQRWCLIPGALIHNHACTLGLGLAVVTEESCAVRASSLFRSAVKCWCRVPFSRFAPLPIVRWCPKSKLLTPCYMCHQKNAILDQCSDVVYCDWWDSVTASACRIGENLKDLGLVPNWSETVPRISNSSWSRLNCVTSCKKIWWIFFKLFL